MSFVKMTDILVSTSAFIVTLTYPAKAKSHNYDDWADINFETVLEVTPIIQSATEDVGLAKKFFNALCSDSSSHNRRFKDHALKTFVEGCTKRDFEQFWDSTNWRTLERLCLRVPNVTCMLYDKTGNVVHMIECSAIEVVRALKRIEEAFFVSVKNVPIAASMHEKKDFRKDQNRSTHKYFLHHKAHR